eukprot:14500486-Alexandrium_andersonii.AAC.1
MAVPLAELHQVLSVLAPLARGRAWRARPRAGGDAMEHSWNAWLTAHPASAEAGDRGPRGCARGRAR